MDIKTIIEEINNNILNSEIYLNNFKIRERIYLYIHNNFDYCYSDILHKLIEIEIKEREEDTYMEYDLLYWCIFLLYRLGDTKDCLIIWKAKSIDFDTSFGVDDQFLIGGGIDETINFLKNIKEDEEVQEILQYIVECQESNEFNDIDKWYDFEYKYFYNFHRNFLESYGENIFD